MQERIYGGANPVLEIVLNPDEQVLSWAADCAWMTDSIEVGQGDGAQKSWLGRMFGKQPNQMQRLVTFRAAKSPGMVAFCPRLPGEVVTLDVRNDATMNYLCASDALLCVEDGVEVTEETELSTIGSGLYAGGFSMLQLTGIGKAWAGVAGECVSYDLRPEESMRVHPGHLAILHDSVEIGIIEMPQIRTPSFPDGLRLIDVTGPGRVWLSSLGVGPLAESIDDFAAPVDLPSTAPAQKTRSVWKEVLFPRP